MLIQINSGHIKPTDAIVEHLNSRVEHELRRFAERVTRIEVHLRDDNGQKGGEDKHCLIEARLAGLDPIVAEDTCADMYLAIDNAAKKLHRAVEHKVERHNEHLAN